MTFKESIDYKVVTPAEALKRTNALRIYGETFLVVFASLVELQAEHLRKLTELKEEVNKLVVVMPGSSSEEEVYAGAHLQIVDFICQTPEPYALINSLAPEKLTLQEPLPDELASLQDSYVKT